MEPVSFALGSVQAVAQLAGVVKRHVSSYTELFARASSIEAKASRAAAVSRRLGFLSECPDICADLFSFTVQDLEEVHAQLSKIDRRVTQESNVMLFLRAPVLIRELDEVDAKLTQLDHLFRIIGMLGMLIASQKAEARMNAMSIASACLSLLNSQQQQNQIYEELESRLVDYTSSSPPTKSAEDEADFAFAMGRRDFEISLASTVKTDIDPTKLKRAARYFRKACELGKREAFRYLGDISYNGHHGEACFRTAAEIYSEGASRNDLPSQHRLALCYELGHGVVQSKRKAIALLTDAADKGWAESMYAVGHLALHGVGIASNHSRAFRLINMAVSRSVEAAKGELAICYRKGIGCERDLEKAFQLVSESYKAGSMWDVFSLVECYDSGDGVLKDPKMATEILEECMSMSTWHRNLYSGLYGLRMVQGLGIEKNETLGKALILNACNEKISYPWYALGECYRYGHGFQMSKNLAKRYYKKAVTFLKGTEAVTRSYEALGQIYENGEGVNVDTRRASKYYLCAAEQLSQVGQWKSAIAFEKGVGQGKHVYRAVYFFKLCASSGHEGAQRKMLSYYMKGHGLERSRTHARRMMADAARAGNRDAKRWLLREDLRDALVHIRRWSL